MNAISKTDEATVTITESEYNRLMRDSYQLQLLEAGGVDNWEWYGESLADYWKALDENNI